MTLTRAGSTCRCRRRRRRDRRARARRAFRTGAPARHRWIAAREQRDARGQQMIRVDPELEPVEFRNAAHHRADRDQQQARERDLADDEHAAHACERAARDAARSVSQRARRRRSRRAKRRQDAGRERGQDRGTDRHRDHGRVGVEVEPVAAGRLSAVMNDCCCPVYEQERERQRDRGRDEAQQQALREQMQHEPRAARAERDAHGKLLAAADRARK